jgi:hypothetical protein
MARFAVGALFGVLVGVTVGAALGIHASSEPESSSAAPPDVPAPDAALERRGDCVAWYESHGIPTAVNPRSGAAGLGQFLRSTWLSTPQGQAGLSVFDPTANRAAIIWMLQVGRAREFAVVGAGLC